ncbi:hypothetical protein P4627_18375, partial [Halalkalibacterium halodurans]|uniref:hypothetical protein n=1 Tax=Halalkalibacterium halodurans TaxID=86665 RepID=UPI002E240A5E|nr:hypothetical protein [Halalkalibacterium halodurans]
SFNPGKSMVKFIVHAAPILSLFLGNSRIMDKRACVHFFALFCAKTPTFIVEPYFNRRHLIIHLL